MDWQNYLVNAQTAKDYECSICLEILRDPVQIGCKEGHVFCSRCVEQLKKPDEHTRRCPQCREEFHTSHKIPIINRQINNLKCKCKNHKMTEETKRYFSQKQKDKMTEISKNSNTGSDNTNDKDESVPLRRSSRIKAKNEKQKRSATENIIGQKRELNNSEEPMLRKKRKLNNNESEESKDAIELCDWIGTVSEFDNHMKKCPLSLTTCRFCRKNILRKDAKTHVDTCLAKPIQCENCNKKNIPRNKMQRHIRKKCPKSVIKCGKCNKTMEREKMKLHLRKECHEVMIDCLYWKFGCDEQHKRKDKKNHNERNAAYHLEIVLSGYNELENKLDRLEERLEQLEDRLEYGSEDSDDESSSE